MTILSLSSGRPFGSDLLESSGVFFRFAVRNKIYEMRKDKLRSIPLEYLFMATPVAMLHSLEAFYGQKQLGFAKIKHNMVNGSLKATPSATAALLMRGGFSIYKQEYLLINQLSVFRRFCCGMICPATIFVLLFWRRSR